MLTCNELMKENRAPKKIWLTMHDVLNHCLIGDHEMSIYKDRLPSRIYITRAREGMATKNFDQEDLNAELETMAPKRRHREKKSDSGTFDVERYLEGDKTPFYDVFSVSEPKPMKTLLIDMTVSWSEIDSDFMRPRHRHIYKEAIKAEAEGTPCRVIGCFSIKIPEQTDPITFYLVVKDFSDPIFPEIWGLLKNNKMSNAAINLIMDFVIGTRDCGNGSLRETQTDGDFPPDEELIIIDSPRVYATNCKRIDTTKQENGYNW